MVLVSIAPQDDVATPERLSVACGSAVAVPFSATLLGEIVGARSGGVASKLYVNVECDSRPALL